jgi:hypothetical protein
MACSFFVACAGMIAECESYTNCLIPSNKGSLVAPLPLISPQELICSNPKSIENGFMECMEPPKSTEGILRPARTGKPSIPRRAGLA